MSRRGRHRRVVAPPTRLGPSEEGDLTAIAPASAWKARQMEPDPARRPAAEDPADALPTRVDEDTDEAWGELPERADDARYLRDKPPHWQ